jgi:hypothetical protein
MVRKEQGHSPSTVCLARLGQETMQQQEVDQKICKNRKGTKKWRFPAGVSFGIFKAKAYDRKEQDTQNQVN